jgi:hypothetical protein
MTFEELLDQAIALLQCRGRLTYRALKRQFNVDDDYTDSLIESRPWLAQTLTAFHDVQALWDATPHDRVYASVEESWHPWQMSGDRHRGAGWNLRRVLDHHNFHPFGAVLQ